MNFCVRTIALCVNIFVTTNIYCDKHNFVVTNVLSWQAYFCCGKHTFVMTKDFFGHNKHMFVMTKVLSWQAYFCQFRWRWAECQILSLPVPLPVSSASTPKQPAPYRPSHPQLATTPLPPLPPSCFLSSGHPGTSVLSCTTLPHLPPSPLAVITWCLNSFA